MNKGQNILVAALVAMGIMLQRVWEIRVSSILKLDRAEKAAPEDQGQDDQTQEDTAA